MPFAGIREALMALKAPEIQEFSFSYSIQGHNLQHLPLYQGTADYFFVLGSLSPKGLRLDLGGRVPQSTHV